MTTTETAFLDAIAAVAVDGESYVTGDAADITSYLLGKMDALRQAKTGKATVQDFINDAENLATTGAALFGNAKVQALVDAIVKAGQDGEAGKVMALIPDGIAIYSDIKGLKTA